MNKSKEFWEKALEHVDEKALSILLERLGKNQKIVIKKRLKGITLLNIANQVDLSPERIRQIEFKGLSKIKHFFSGSPYNLNFINKFWGSNFDIIN